MRKILLIDTNYEFTTDVESRLILDDIEGADIHIRNDLNNIHDAISRLNPTELLIEASLCRSHPDWNFGIPVKSYAKNSEGIQDSADKKIPCYGIIKTAKELLQSIQADVPISVQEEKVSVSVSETKAQVLSAEPENKIEESKKEEQEDLFNSQEVVSTTTAETPVSIPSIEAVVTQQQNTPQQSGYTPMDMRARLAEAHRKEEEERKKNEAAIRKNMQLEQEVERDLGNIKPPAKVVTVYSAKGGVGKTTISTELATFLALTSHGRGKFRVCIVDYNIDFGDVLNTLSFDAGKSCMTIWAADIKEKLQSGMKPEDITYTEAQISVYLQQNDKDELWALIAPLTNEDSMNIEDIELKIMLDNIVKNGGFDFVVCDTGNNTRDSSVIALDLADEVLLVMTQDVNTANCNGSFLSTMHQVGFDMNKIRLVVNKIRPAKMVAISAEELEEAFINPLTDKPYPCIAKIRDHNEVKHAVNLGEPLVYRSSHEFTKGISEIAKEVIGDDFVLGKPEKKSVFKRLFKK